MRENINVGNTIARANYADAVAVGSTIYIAGQVSVDPETGEVIGEGDPTLQAIKVFENIELVLKQCRGCLGDIVSMRTFLLDGTHFKAVQLVRKKFLGEARVAGTSVIVAGLLGPPGLLLEIEVVAKVNVSVKRES